MNYYDLNPPLLSVLQLLFRGRPAAAPLGRNVPSFGWPAQAKGTTPASPPDVPPIACRPASAWQISRPAGQWAMRMASRCVSIGAFPLGIFDQKSARQMANHFRPLAITHHPPIAEKQNFPPRRRTSQRLHPHRQPWRQRMPWLARSGVPVPSLARVAANRAFPPVPHRPSRS